MQPDPNTLYLDGRAQASITEAILSLADMAAHTKNRKMIADLRDIIIALIPAAADSKIDFIGFNEYLLYIDDALEAGKDPRKDPGVQRERDFVLDDLSRLKAK